MTHWTPQFTIVIVGAELRCATHRSWKILLPDDRPSDTLPLDRRGTYVIKTGVN